MYQRSASQMVFSGGTNAGLANGITGFAEGIADEIRARRRKGEEKEILEQARPVLRKFLGPEFEDVDDKTIDSSIKAMGGVEGMMKAVEFEQRQAAMKQQMETQALKFQMAQMEMDQMRQQQEAFRKTDRTAGNLASGIQAPYSREILDNPYLQAQAQHHTAFGQAARDMKQLEPLIPKQQFQPSFTPAEKLGGRAGDLVFQGSPNSAQVVPEQKPTRPPGSLAVFDTLVERGVWTEETRDALSAEYGERLAKSTEDPVRALVATMLEMGMLGGNRPNTPTPPRRAAPAAQQFHPEGTVVEQNGRRYRRQGDQWVEIK